MEETLDLKEKIIIVTTQLIEQSTGDITSITTRKIASKANIAIGLINYHFGSKEKLITECVQRKIKQIVYSFTPEKSTKKKMHKLDAKTNLTLWAQQVFEFLFNNNEISIISILGDLQNYQISSNTVSSQKGLALSIANELEEKEKRFLTFILVSTMQVAFLAKTTIPEILGYDFSLKKDRNAFVSKTVNSLWRGIHKGPNK